MKKLSLLFLKTLHLLYYHPFLEDLKFTSNGVKRAEKMRLSVRLHSEDGE